MNSKKNGPDKDDDFISPDMSNSGVHILNTGLNSTGKSTMFHAQLESPGRTYDYEITNPKIENLKNEPTFKKGPYDLTPILTQSSQ